MKDLFSDTRSLKECVYALNIYIDKFEKLKYTKMQYSLKMLQDEMYEKINKIENLLKELKNDKKDS